LCIQQATIATACRRDQLSACRPKGFDHWHNPNAWIGAHIKNLLDLDTILWPTHNPPTPGLQ
jgi:hypothetical protein